MSKRTRVSRRKKQVLQLLRECSPQGIAMLNELRVRSMWADRAGVGAISQADHMRSFNRTLLEHGDPFEMLDLMAVEGDDFCGVSAGMFARWAVWHFIERGWLSGTPDSEQLELFMGWDACTAVIKGGVCDFAVVGGCCYLNSLQVVAKKLSLGLVECLTETPYRVNGITENGWQVLKPDTLVSRLERLPGRIYLENGKILSMSKDKRF